VNNTYKTSEGDRARSKAWREANPEKDRANKNAWYEANKEKTNARSKAWYAANKDRFNSGNKAKYACDIPFKLRKLVRDACIRATERKIGKQEAIDLLGCTLEEYKEYLESKFQPGMTWENHTKDGWHIDHILPLNESDTSLTEEEKLKRVHYTNTQPLWATDNIKKGNKRSGEE